MSVANDAQFIIEHRDENAFCNSFSVPSSNDGFAHKNTQLSVRENVKIPAKWTLVDLLGRVVLEGDSRESVFKQMQIFDVESTVYLLGSFDKSGRLIKYEKIFVRSN